MTLLNGYKTPPAKELESGDSGLSPPMWPQSHTRSLSFPSPNLCQKSSSNNNNNVSNSHSHEDEGKTLYEDFVQEQRIISTNKNEITAGRNFILPKRPISLSRWEIINANTCKLVSTFPVNSKRSIGTWCRIFIEESAQSTSRSTLPKQPVSLVWSRHPEVFSLVHLPIQVEHPRRNSKQSWVLPGIPPHCNTNISVRNFSQR